MVNKSKKHSAVDNMFHRTSVTIDESVAILFGWISVPVAYTCASENPTVEEQEYVDSMQFDLYECIDDEETPFINAHFEAKHNKESNAVIAEKKEALSAFRLKVKQANTCLCNIHDELNRGDQSELRIDVKLSSTACTYITLSSLARWAKKNGCTAQVLVDAPTCITSKDPGTLPASGERKPRQKLLEQEEAIVAEIRKLGYDPKTMPKLIPGKAGVKAKVTQSLKSDPLFSGPTTFKHAWDRLRQEKTIGHTE